MLPLHQPDPLPSEEKRAWWQLSRTEQVGPITFFRLLDRYGSASRALSALPDLARRGGRKTPLAAFSQSRAEDELAALDKIGAHVIALIEPDYPVLLAAIDDAPPLITVRGSVESWKNPCIGMVGARNASLSGRKMAENLARDLAAADYTVASGLARGIDTAAHEGAGPGHTIAVLAGGVDIVYPPENKDLYARIKDGGGALISENPAGMEPMAQHFPRRNRIISGLSLGTVVVEATLKSGSLITARMALEQGRDVFAVPGSPLDPRAGGPNALIRDGATLTENASQIIEQLSQFRGKSLPVQPDDPALPGLAEAPSEDLGEAREIILKNISPTPVPVDELIRSCELSPATAHAALLELELAGRLERLPGGRIALIA